MGKYLAILILAFSLPAFASPDDCATLMESAYGQIKPDFAHTNRYDVELASPFTAKNQCATSFCHLYAWSADLENPAGIQISSEYVSVFYFREEARKALSEGNVRFTGQLGSNSFNSIASIRKSGIIPQGAWKGKTDYNRPPQIGRMLGALRAIIGRAKELREAEKDPNVQAQINWQAYTEIDKVFASFVGEIPLSFEYQGEVHTPLTFAEKYFPRLSQPLVTVSAPADQIPRGFGEEEKDILKIHTTVDELHRTAKALLDKGHPVYLAYQHEDMFADDKSGILSISAFNYPEFAAPLSRDSRRSLKLLDGMHAVLLVGYELDPETGKVKKWKIQNSWGEKRGENGFYHMYDDYFRANVMSITYLNDGKVPVPSYLVERPEQGFD